MNSNILLQLSRSRTSYNLQGALRKFHQRTLPGVPEVPFVDLYDPSKYFLISENGSPLKYLEPEIPKMDAETLRLKAETAVQEYIKFKERMFLRYSEIYLFIFPKQGPRPDLIELARNYFVVYGGNLGAEMVNLTEKLKPNVSEIRTKLSEMSNKLPLSTVQKQLNDLKEKLPVWQRSVATKLQNIQDTINKKLN